MKKINISICGALGKMGKILIKKISINMFSADKRKEF